MAKKEITNQSKVKKARSKQEKIVLSHSADDNMSLGAGVASLKKNNIDKYDEFESYKILRKKRKKRAWIRAFVWLLVILISPIIVFFSLVIISPSSGVNFFGYTFYIVESESMRPVFDIHDLVVIKHIGDKNEIQIGTDISFTRKTDGKIVTHRVIDIIEKENGNIEYITKGVNNLIADEGSVSFENIIGRRVTQLTALGHIVMFFRTWVGILVFLVIFFIIVVGFVVSFRYSNDIRSVGVK